MKSKNSSGSILFKTLSVIIKLVPMYLLFLAIALFFSMVTRYPFAVKGYFIYAFGVAATYLIRQYVTHLTPYICLHALLCPVMIVLGGLNPLLIGLTLLFMLLFYIYAYNFWCSDEVSAILKLPEILVLMSFVFYLASLRVGPAYSSSFFVLSILYVCSTITVNYIIRMEIYLIANQENDSISLSSVLIRNTKSGMCLLIALMLLPVIGANPWVQKLALMIWHFLTGLIQPIEVDNVKPSAMPEASPTISPTPTIYRPNFYEISIVGKILHVFLVVLGCAFLASLVIYVIWSLVKLFRSGKLRKHKKRENDDYSGIEEIRIKVKRPPKKHTVPFRRKSQIDKVREQYYKTIKEYQKSGYEIKAEHSPLERREDIAKTFKDDLAELTEAYEKVRYDKTEK